MRASKTSVKSDIRCNSTISFNLILIIEPNSVYYLVELVVKILDEILLVDDTLVDVVLLETMDDDVHGLSQVSLRGTHFLPLK